MIADEEIRRRLAGLPVLFLGFFVLSLITKKWQGIAVISAIGCLYTFGIGLKLVLQRKALRRIQSILPGDSVAPERTEQDPGFVIPARFSHFYSLSIPRKLKMKRVFRLATILLLLMALIFTCGSYSMIVPPHTAPDDPRWGFRLGLVALAIYGAMFGSWWVERRRKRLLRSGELQFARVVDSGAGRGASFPGVRYTFQTADGKEIEGFSQDWTDSFHLGMVIPVFYDSGAPENCVAMCGSFYDVI